MTTLEDEFNSTLSVVQFLIDWNLDKLDST